MEKLLADVLFQQLDKSIADWLKEKAEAVKVESAATHLNMAFTIMPRKTGKQIIAIASNQQRSIQASMAGFSIKEWSIDRLSRVWLLLQVNDSDKAIYIQKIEQLFLTAEMNELVALYSALPLLSYPDAWKHRCTEGIRSNIALVLEAIMYENPYPAEWLDENEWNQMVLKAFFTDKNIDRITGIDKRANRRLAATLLDYAHERWQAGRKVNPQLWRLVGKFINQESFGDLQKVYHEGNITEKKAAVLACFQSEYAPAREFANEVSESVSITEDTSWNSLINEPLEHSNN